MWFSLSVGVLILFLFFFVLGKSSPDVFPGPSPLPILGNNILLLKNRHRFLDFITELQKEYGSTFRLFNRGHQILFLLDPVDIQVFLMEKFENFERSVAINKRFKELFGNGIFTSTGENWKHQRATARPMFTKDSLCNMVKIFVKNGEKLVRILETSEKTGNSIDMQDLFQRYTLDSIGEIGFGHDLGTLASFAAGKTQQVKFAKAFDHTQSVVDMAHSNPMLLYFTPSEYRENLEYLNKFVSKIIFSRRKELEAEEEDASAKKDNAHIDLLSRFMTLSDSEGNPLPDSYLRDVVLNFFIAGRDTTASLLTWTFYLLSTHPEAEAKLRNEINDAIETTDDITYDNVKQLKYTRNVLKESLRLFPPVSVDGRRCMKDTQLPSGKVISEGTFVLYSSYVTHRLEEYWGKDAASFNPDRFNTTLKNQFQFVPFHAGPQVCLGQSMALTEAAIVIILIVKANLKLDLKEGHVVKPRKSIVLVADSGLNMTVSRC